MWEQFWFNTIYYTESAFFMESALSFWTQALDLRRSKTHVFVQYTFINLMKGPNEEALIFWVSASTISCFDIDLLMKWCLYDE